MYTIQVPGEPGNEARGLGNHLVLVQTKNKPQYVRISISGSNTCTGISIDVQVLVQQHGVFRVQSRGGEASLPNTHSSFPPKSFKNYLKYL